jgi:hypothetical protein
MHTQFNLLNIKELLAKYLICSVQYLIIQIFKILFLYSFIILTISTQCLNRLKQNSFNQFYAIQSRQS